MSRLVFPRDGQQKLCVHHHARAACEMKPGTVVVTDSENNFIAATPEDSNKILFVIDKGFNETIESIINEGDFVSGFAMIPGIRPQVRVQKGAYTPGSMLAIDGRGQLRIASEGDIVVAYVDMEYSNTKPQSDGEYIPVLWSDRFVL